MNVPKKGDRVRITDEGEVTYAHPMAGGSIQRTRLTVKRDDGSTFYIGMSDRMKPKVEVIEQPLVIGGVYMDNDGEIFRYNGISDPNRVWTEFTAYDDDQDYTESYPNKPLRRLDGAK